jgi:glycosyltransferase involved in cell wall biosynthesis
MRIQFHYATMERVIARLLKHFGDEGKISIVTTHFSQKASMRILVAHNRYRLSSGEEAVVAAETEMLRRHGHSVDVWMPSSDEIDGLTATLRTAWNLPYSRTMKQEMRARLELSTPDVVHVHNFFPLLTTSIYDACHDMLVPVVQTLHNYRTICAAATLMRNGRPCRTCVDHSPYWGVFHSCYRGSPISSAPLARMIDKNARRRVWQRVDRFIALSQFARNIFVEAGFPADRIAVKQNFLLSHNVTIQEPESGRHGALFVGRLTEEKGIRLMLEAWRGLEVPLRIVGGGPLMQEVQRRQTPWIKVLGPLPHNEVQQLMQQSAVLVFPSLWYEGMPMSIVEAFRASLPVIASRLGVMAEMIEDSRTGLHFTAADAGDLRAKVEWAMQNPITMRKFGRQAFLTFIENYTAESNHAALLAIYHAAISQARTSSSSASVQQSRAMPE